MKYFLLVMLTVLIGCSKDKVVVKHNDDRVSDLERRVLLLEQLSVIMQADILTNSNEIIAEKQARVDALNDLNDSLTDFVNAALSGYVTQAEKDDLIQQATVAYNSLSDKDADLQAQLDALMSEVNSIVPEVHFNFNFNIPFLIGTVNYTINNNVQQIADLTAINDQLSVMSGQILDNENRIDDLENAVADLQSQIDELNKLLSTLPNTPTLNATCQVNKVQDYGNEKHYEFKLLNSTGLVGDYKVEVTRSDNSGSLRTDNNGNFSFSGGKYSFTPINGATQFLIYSASNNASFIQTAKVIKISTGESITCSVNNSL